MVMAGAWAAETAAGQAQISSASGSARCTRQQRGGGHGVAVCTFPAPADEKWAARPARKAPIAQGYGRCSSHESSMASSRGPADPSPSVVETARENARRAAVLLACG